MFMECPLWRSGGSTLGSPFRFSYFLLITYLGAGLWINSFNVTAPFLAILEIMDVRRYILFIYNSSPVKA